ncbi:DEAD/DEAH box helicase [Fervidicoccus fontis]|uniref:DNA 3'-5' helicase n=2 Tax=Fervidicoccus fontis TaxID=683846 RepID=I0A180_FERFK|nr:DEAD/DEAH box helicase [Fervidicoccus fontis]AFH42737.1 type III restriction enzyme, res subunit [Fervidicoccus fontis Kam940]MBE9391342.1 DEAD/DEAH box helicase [Fervidicoccus fontis]
MSGNDIAGGNQLKFRVKGWIDREIFANLMRFSDYKGRENGESLFEINYKKIRENGITLEEVLNTLKSLGDKVPPLSIQALENIIKGGNKITLYLENDEIVLKPNSYIKDLFVNLKEYLVYEREKKIFKVYPGKYFDLLKKAKDIGLEIENKTGLPDSLKMSKKINFKGELRNYQKEALESWKNNSSRGIIALPTGSGKTVIGAAAIAELGEMTLIITYTKEQLLQWMEMLKNFTDIPQSMIAAFYSEEKRIAPITISTYQTAFRHIKTLAYRFSLLVVDEVHHLPADKFKTIALGMYSPHRLGLSATVIREDGKHVELFPLMGGVIYYKTPQELVEKGFLSPYASYIVKVGLSKEEEEKYEKLKNIYKALTLGIPFAEVLKRAKSGDSRMAKALKIHNEMVQIYQKAKAKEEAVKKIVEQELKNGSKILVFTQYVEQAEKLGNMLGAPVLTGSTETKLRKKILEDFKKAQSGVLVLTTVGDEGLDIPDVNVGIIVAGTGSRRQFVQRLGRLLRPKPEKTAKLYEIVTKGTAEESLARKRKKLEIDSDEKEKKSKQTKLF